MARKGQADGIEKKHQVLDVETIASVGQGRRRRERQPTAAALCGKTRQLKPRRRSPEQPPARGQRKAPRSPTEVEIACRGAARRRQLDASDRLPGDFSPGELREPGEDLRAPQVGDLKVDFEALESARGYGHPVAIRRDRERLLSISSGGAGLRLKSAAELRENERRQIVEICRAEAQVAGRQGVGANDQRPSEARRSETKSKIVDRPAAVVMPCDMRRPLKSMAVDISG